LRCWDKDWATSDPIGFVKCKASAFMINNGVEDWYTLYLDNKDAGKILIVS